MHSLSVEVEYAGGGSCSTAFQAETVSVPATAGGTRLLHQWLSPWSGPLESTFIPK